MKQPLTLGAALLALAAPAVGHAQSADQLVDQMLLAEQAGLDAVENYLLKTNAMGMTTVEYFEKSSSITLDNGQTVHVMRSVPPGEIQRRHSAGNALADASPEQLEEAARVIKEQGEKMEDTFRQEIQAAGLPAGIGDMLMNPPADQPWLSANPSDMAGMYAMMLNTAAEGKREEAAADPAAAAREMQAAMAEVKARSRVVGQDTLDGRPAMIIEAANLNRVESFDGREFTAERLRLWLDADKKLPLRMQIEGVLREGNESRAMTIQRDDRDYRSVPGCGDMHRPFSSVMRISGMLNAAEQAELQQAQAQMADLDKQLAAMPPAQREMIMRQMGPQLKMIENMATGGGIEVATELVELRCNEGLPDPRELAQSGPAGLMPAALTGERVPAGSAGASSGALDTLAGGSAAGGAASAAQQQCLQEKIEQAQAAQKQKRGFGKMLGAVSRTAGQLGNTSIGRAVQDFSSATSTVDDLTEAARDLGLAQDEIDQCSQ
jgi:hypothetical protein